ncbi:MAG: ribonuclease HII [Enterococcus sp.]
MTETIQQVKEKLKAISSLSDPYVLSLSEDTRSGVQAALKSLKTRIEKGQKLKEKYQEMLTFERAGYHEGHRLIAGIDEVGRGPLAGPVVAAAVILPEECEILGLNDSKQLSAKKREELCKQIEDQAIAIGLGVIDEQTIDAINIYQSSKEAMKLAVADLEVTPTYLLIDAMELDLSIQQESLIKGDARSVSIAAASIVAKVFRDNLMKEYGEKYPGYGFENNAGYGTKEHLDGLQRFGITPIHRKTFAPVKNYVNLNE